MYSDTDRLNWLEMNRAEIIISSKIPFIVGVFAFISDQYYTIIWDNLNKEIKGKNLRETIDMAMDYVQN